MQKSDIPAVSNQFLYIHCFIKNRFSTNNISFKYIKKNQSSGNNIRETKLSPFLLQLQLLCEQINLKMSVFLNQMQGLFSGWLLYININFPDSDPWFPTLPWPWKNIEETTGAKRGKTGNRCQARENIQTMSSGTPSAGKWCLRSCCWLVEKEHVCSNQTWKMLDKSRKLKT